MSRTIDNLYWKLVLNIAQNVGELPLDVSSETEMTQYSVHGLGEHESQKGITLTMCLGTGRHCITRCINVLKNNCWARVKLLCRSDEHRTDHGPLQQPVTWFIWSAAGNKTSTNYCVLFLWLWFVMWLNKQALRIKEKWYRLCNIVWYYLCITQITGTNTCNGNYMHEHKN